MKRIRKANDEIYDYEAKIEIFEEFAEEIDNLEDDMHRLQFLGDSLNLTELTELFGLSPDTYEIYQEYLDKMLEFRQLLFVLHLRIRADLERIKEKMRKSSF